MDTERSEILNTVRKAEREAEEKIADAQRKSKELQMKAVRETSEIIRAAENEGKLIYGKIIEEKIKSLETIKKEMISAGEEEAKIIKRRAESNLAKSVDFLISKLGSGE